MGSKFLNKRSFFLLEKKSILTL